MVAAAYRNEIERICSSTTVKEIIQCTGLSTKNLFTGININEFSLNHVEADTAVFTIYNKIRESSWKGTGAINAEDTDIYVQAAYVSQKVSVELLIKKKNSWTLDLRVGRWTLTLDSGRWTLDSGRWTLHARLWTLDAGFWTLDARLWTLDGGLWTLDPGHCR